MHHKFTMIHFDKPTARVYLDSYNFSAPTHDIAASSQPAFSETATTRSPHSREGVYSLR
jgi:hypothetical protein